MNTLVRSSASRRGRPTLDRLSVVVPVFNEAAVLPAFHARLEEVLNSLSLSTDVVYVDDGSRDGSAAVLRRLRMGDPRVGVITLSRNFGKEAALTAGLDHATGDAVVIIDADLQDPPELIVPMVQAWREGHDVVTMRRVARAGESVLRRTSADAFYGLLNRVSDVPIPLDTGDFRLLSRRAVNALCRMPERNRYMKGLFAWIGFPQKELQYERDARAAGGSHWSYPRLLGLALDGFTSFTWRPLRFATYAGLVTAVAALSFGVWIIAKTLMFGDPVQGYPTMMTVILVLGGAQLLAIGIQSEYLGRLFAESKQRPLYLVQSVQPARDRRELAEEELT
jgi:polyisoprenyl-phosphate glycosyltransferase